MFLFVQSNQAFFDTVVKAREHLSFMQNLTAAFAFAAAASARCRRRRRQSSTFLSPFVFNLESQLKNRKKKKIASWLGVKKEWKDEKKIRIIQADNKNEMKRKEDAREGEKEREKRDTGKIGLLFKDKVLKRAEGIPKQITNKEQLEEIERRKKRGRRGIKSGTEENEERGGYRI